MTDRYCLDVRSPACGFMDSFLLGNGHMGATLRSGVGEERIDINLDGFWSGGPQKGPEGGSPAPLLPTLRQAIRQRDFERADEISMLMQGKGWTQSYQPMTALLWRYERSSGPDDVTDYRRRLDLSIATAEHTYARDGEPVLVTSFVSGPENLVVATAQGPALLPVAEMGFHWDCQHPCVTRDWTEGQIRWIKVQGRAPTSVIPPYVRSDLPIVYDEKPADPDGSVDAGMGFCVVAALAPVAEGCVRLLIAAECGFRGAFARPSADLDAMAERAISRVRSALEKDTSSLHDAHKLDYRYYFDRNDLELPQCPEAGTSDPAKAELLYHFGRYLLISSSRPGTEAANLQGIWNPYLRPAWSSNHTTNINTEMNYWLAEPAGLGDLAGPLNDMVSELVDAGRQSARHFYGAPGAVVHHNTDLWRFTQPVEGTPVWANWTSALPWLLCQCWDHWEYGSGDDDFARNRLLPMLEEVSRFALFMLVEDQDGHLIVSPSSSPEHAFRDRNGNPRGVTEGAAMDQQLYGQLLHRLVVLSRHLGKESELTIKAEKALWHLRGVDIGSDGVVKEWAGAIEGAEQGHRHLSHLYAIYPGDGFIASKDSATVKAFRAALEERLTHGTGYTGWSQSWILCLAARFGEAGLAEMAIRNLLGELTTRALLVLHPYENVPDNAVFQIDGNFGATAGILEVLVQSYSGLTVLLSALPVKWTTGKLSGAVIRGGHKIDLLWQNRLLSDATIYARKDDVVTLDIPAGSRYQVIRASDGLKCTFISSADTAPGRQRLAWKIVSNEVYKVTSVSL